jgi:hypothetical protein
VGAAATEVEQLHAIADALLTRLDPNRRMTALYDPDQAQVQAR